MRIDARKLDCGKKMILKDVREMVKFIDGYSIRNGGIQPDQYIDKIKDCIENTILVPAQIVPYKKMRRI